jgi:hypothetical protein
MRMKRRLMAEQKLSAFKAAAKKLADYTNAGLVSLICRDADEKLLSVAVYVEGQEAAALERWLKRRER